MARQNKRQSEDRELARKFEEQLKEGTPGFFDVSIYESIIQYYLELTKFRKAHKTCEIAMEQHPYSVEIMLLKVQVLMQMTQFEEALEILDRAQLYQPNDTDIQLLRANILAQQDDFEGALEILKEILDTAE